MHLIRDQDTVLQTRGINHRVGTSGIDSRQAAWEYALDQKMGVPPVRFQKPMLMDPGAMKWQGVIGHPSTGTVQQRTVWNFGFNTVSLVVYQLAAGASLTLTGTLSCFVEYGNGDVAGKANAFRDVAHLAATENMRFTAAADTRLLVFIHPVFEEAPPAHAALATQPATTRAKALT